MGAVKKLAVLILLLCWAPVAYAQGGDMEIPLPRPLRNDPGWELVFYDDFDGTELDLTKWSYNYPWGQTHNHRAYMSAENVRVEDGVLKLVAENRRHPDAPQTIVHVGETYSLDYTSGVVTTKDKFEFTYGYIEARLKVPATKGFWPAFWTLNSEGGWPPEIDIMEILTKEPDVLHINYHYGPSWDRKWSFYQKFTFFDFTQDFNTFAVKWTPSEMAWYLNDVLIGKKFYEQNWIAQLKDNYILINLAVSGWGGDPDETTQWPGVYEIDWVRVWLLEGSEN